MLAERPRSRCFSDKERTKFLALARAALPAGRVFPGAGPASVDKVENFLALSPPSVGTAYRAMLWTLDASALVHYRRPLDRLGSDEILALLERWRTGDYPSRMLVRLLTIPLKVAHFNDRAMFDAVGCRYGALTVVTEPKPRYMTERVTTAAQLPLDDETECDVVVIGTGAGGAVAARELAEQGHAVVLLEEGQYHTRADFTGHSTDMQRKLYRDMGATIAMGNVNIPIPIGRSVGGTTTINSGTCYRAPARIFESWQEEHGLRDFSADSMAPYYERVEEVLQVTVGDAKMIGGVGRVIARGCDALGYKHHPIRRNAPACDGQGVCCFGCPTDAKRSTNVSYVPLALKAGTQLFTGVTAERILVENGRAVGVVARAGGKRLTARARAVVVACGALLTPVLLEKNKLCGGSGQLGRNLSIHPAIGTMALYDETIDGGNAIPQGYAIEEFHDEGILFEGAFAPLDIGAASFSSFGPKLVEVLEQYRHLAAFGLMIEDTSRGRVRVGPGGRPFITYWLNRHDVARLKRSVEILARVYFASGAKKVLPLVHGFDELNDEADVARFRAARLNARDFDISAYHPLGTARMGADPSRSVIGPDCQAHDLPGLYVTDGSAIPTSPAVNPQMTIMAVATRAAQQLGEKLAG
jgi:choline dehydrogenase-like flavoprotein